MLVTLNRSLKQTDMNTLGRLITAGDDLLLMQDAVTAAIAGSSMLQLLIITPARLHVLEEDWLARGLGGLLAEQFTLVNYAGFVQLSLKHCQQLAW